MKILVVVGTGGFDDLHRAVNSLVSDEITFEVLHQIGAGRFCTERRYSECVRYVPTISKMFKDFDLIVAHCGAGLCFEILETGIPLLVVPNTVRPDQHQLDLAKYLEHETTARVCWHHTDVSISDLRSPAPARYHQRPPQCRVQTVLAAATLPYGSRVLALSSIPDGISQSDIGPISGYIPTVVYDTKRNSSDESKKNMVVKQLQCRLADCMLPSVYREGFGHSLISGLIRILKRLQKLV